jgi:hypothetical protein
MAALAMLDETRVVPSSRIWIIPEQAAIFSATSRGGTMRYFIFAVMVLSLVVGRGMTGAADNSELQQIKSEIQKTKADEERNASATTN